MTRPERKGNAEEKHASFDHREAPLSLIELQSAAGDSDRRAMGSDCEQHRRWQRRRVVPKWLKPPVEVIAALLMVISLVWGAFAQEGPEERVQTTDHYRITLEIGPLTPIGIQFTLNRTGKQFETVAPGREGNQ